MTSLELTQIQANRWNRHLKDGRNARGGVSIVTTPKRQQDAISLYQIHGSLSCVARELKMGRVTLKRILKTNGVSL